MLGAVALGVLLYLLAPILMPFVVGAGLAYLGDPLVDRLQKHGLSRTGGVAVVFAVLSLVGLVATLLVLPLLIEQSITFVRNIPDYLKWIQDTGLPALGVELPDDLRMDSGNLSAMIAEN